MDDIRCFTCQYGLCSDISSNCNGCDNYSEWKEIEPKRLLDNKIKLNNILVEYLDDMIKLLTEEEKQYIWDNYNDIDDIECLIEIGMYTREEAENRLFKRYIAENFIYNAMY